jgi:hypothetical protein
MEAGEAAEWLLHADSDLTYAKLGQAEPAILRNQVAFHAEQATQRIKNHQPANCECSKKRKRDIARIVVRPELTGGRHLG